jgi:homoserine O-succinyltransferase
MFSRGNDSLRSAKTPVRIGVINIMPKLETYEPLLLGPLVRSAHAVDPVLIRLESHDYTSSDPSHLGRFYRPFADVIAEAPLDGLILSGAPVEELEFADVHYWRELSGILDYAKSNVKSTLGLCWGALALAHLVGIPKIVLPQKIFGVFENRVLDGRDPIMQGQRETFRCAHSRHSTIEDAELENAASDGRVRLLSHAKETGYSLFESTDRRFVMHLGHPEYLAERIAFEWKRDQTLGRDDVRPPHDFDPDAPVTSWHDHRESLFGSWIRFVAPS